MTEKLDLDLETLSSMIENLITGVCVFTYKEGAVEPVYLNEGFFRMLGYSRTVGMRYLKDVRRSIINEDIPAFEQGILDILKDDGPVDLEFRTVTGSGDLRWLQVRGNLYSRKGTLCTVVAVVADITEKKNVEEELMLQAERLHLLSQAAGEKIFDYNAKTDVMILRDSGQRFGEKILNKYLECFDTSLMYPADVKPYQDAFRTALRSPKHDVIEFRSKRFDPDYTWYQANITSILGSEGYVTRVIGRMINIHEKKLKELDLKLRAEIDPLTGLYNRGVTTKLIDKILDRKNKRDAGERGKLHAFMILDLDNFKTVNDVMGHAKGDEVLIGTAEKLDAIFRGGDVVGRIGGDEFVVFMTDMENISDVDVLAARVKRELNLTLSSEMGDIEVTCSMGIALYPYHGESYEELFLKADKALYTAKANGKSGYRIYDAATTIAYHANRKNGNEIPDKETAIDKSLEDLILKILYEDRVMESSLKSTLELMTVHYGFQKGYICGDTDMAPELPSTLVFAVDGYESGRETQEQYRRRLAMCASQFQSHKNFTILHAYDEMTEEDRSYLAAEGIRVMVYYPIVRSGAFKGAIVFEGHLTDEIELTTRQDEEIRSLLRILEAYILRIGLMDRLQDFVTHIEMLDNMDNYIYIVDADTHELSFINKKVAVTTPDVKIGDTCYKVMNNRDTPCEDCIMRQLSREDPHSRFTEECFNYSLRSWNRCSASWLECRENNATCILNCFDISEYFLG